jgi:hypothetical protein
MTLFHPAAWYHSQGRKTSFWWRKIKSSLKREEPGRQVTVLPLDFAKAAGAPLQNGRNPKVDENWVAENLFSVTFLDGQEKQQKNPGHTH